MMLAANFALIIMGLCQALATRCATERALQPTGLLIWSRLNEAATQFQDLFARWREGRLQASRKRVEQARPRKRAAAEAEPKSSLPRGFAWLVKLVPEAAVYGSQLQHLLTTDPQLAAMLAEAPQAGRILRPICRMLGVEPLPQMRPHRPSKAHTPAPEPAPPKTPPRTPSDPPAAATTAKMTAEMTARQKQRWIAENITPGLRRSLPKDPEELRRLRPFTMWWRTTPPRQ